MSVHSHFEIGQLYKLSGDYVHQGLDYSEYYLLIWDVIQFFHIPAISQIASSGSRVPLYQVTISTKCSVHYLLGPAQLRV